MAKLTSFDVEGDFEFIPYRSRYESGFEVFHNEQRLGIVTKRDVCWMYETPCNRGSAQSRQNAARILLWHSRNKD